MSPDLQVPLIWWSNFYLCLELLCLFLVIVLFFVEPVANLYFLKQVKKSIRGYIRLDVMFLRIKDIVNKCYWPFSDSGAGDVGGVIGEGDLLPTKLNVAKIGSITMQSAAILPSPILLWRFKVLFHAYFFFCGSCC